MYEIWLAINILYELALMYLPFILTVITLWVVLLVYALQHQADWRKGLRGGIFGGIAVAALTFLIFPYITKSSLADLSYWIDYVFLFQIAAGYGVVVGLGFIWPIAALRCRAKIA